MFDWILNAPLACLKTSTADSRSQFLQNIVETLALENFIEYDLRH